MKCASKKEKKKKKKKKKISPNLFTWISSQNMDKYLQCFSWQNSSLY